MKKWLTGIFYIVVSCGITYAQPASWTSRGIGGGGSFYQPSINPNSNTEIFVTSDMSDFYHTTDFGLHWTLIDFRQFWGSGNAGKVQYIIGSTTIYAINAKDEVSFPCKSTDDGATWKPIGSDPTGGGAFGLFVDPNNANRMIISDYNNVYCSLNNGTSFTQVYAGSGCHLAGAFFNNTNIFIGTNLGILTSTDGGTSFTMVPTPGIGSTEAIVSFAGAQKGSTTRFVCVTLGTGDVYPGVTGGEHPNYKNLYTMDLGSPSWTSRSAAVPAGTHPFFVGMALNCIDTILIAGGSSSSAPTVIKSVNGGSTWQSAFLTTGNQNIATGWCGDSGDFGWSFPEYSFGFSVAPNNIRRAAITTMSDVHVTTDAGSNWQQAYLSSSDQNIPFSKTPKGREYAGNGLENTSGWSVAWASHDTIVAGLTDIRGMLSVNGGAKWSFGYTGHTLNTMYHVIKNEQTSTLYAATSSVHDMYQSTYLTDARIDGGTGKVLFSANGGVTWQTLHDFAHPVIWLAIDPNNMNRMYASVIHSTLGGIFVSNDIQNGSSSTWTKLANPPRTEGHPFNIVVLNDGTLVCTYSGRRTSNFTASSGVFISTNNGTSWIDRSAAQMEYWTKDIVVDPFDVTQDKWYVGVFSGWGGQANNLGGLYRTTDRGQSWIKIFNTVPSVTSCTIHPLNKDVMYVTTEANGLWYSSNASKGIPVFTQVASYPFKHPERVFINPYNETEVWVLSFGAGIYTGSANPVPVELSAFTARPEGQGVRLAWTTETETNNAGFAIERKNEDDPAWRSITSLRGAGTTDQETRYEYFDKNVSAGNTYRYRLQQTDIDGTVKMSAEQVVSMPAGNNLSILGNYPNPFNGATSIDYSIPMDGAVSITISDILGRIVAMPVVNQFHEKGTHRVAFSAAELPGGLYLCTLRVAGKMITHRLTVLK